MFWTHFADLNPEEMKALWKAIRESVQKLLDDLEIAENAAKDKDLGE